MSDLVTVRVDLTHASTPTFKGWRSVEIEGDWAMSAKEIRRKVAIHYGVALKYVGEPQPKYRWARRQPPRASVYDGFQSEGM